MKRWGKGYIYGFDSLKTKLKKKKSTTTTSVNMVDSTVLRPKAKEVYGNISQGQENGKPSSDCDGWLPCFKR